MLLPFSFLSFFPLFFFSVEFGEDGGFLNSSGVDPKGNGEVKDIRKIRGAWIQGTVEEGNYLTTPKRVKNIKVRGVGSNSRKVRGCLESRALRTGVSWATSEGASLLSAQVILHLSP